LLLVVLVAVELRRRAPEVGPPPDLTSEAPAVGLGTALAAGLGGLLLGGIPLAAGWAAGQLPRARRRAAVAGATALAASGVLAATSPGLADGRPGSWADAAAALGVGLLLAHAVRLRGGRDAGRRGGEAR
jgi:hypothetical protein